MKKRLLSAPDLPQGMVPLGVAIGNMKPLEQQAWINAVRYFQANLPGDIGDYNTATLLEVLYALPQAPELIGFWLQWFPRTINFETQEIRFDVEDLNEYRLAPFVAPNVQGRVLRERGFNVRTFRPAYIKPKHAIDPTRAIPRRAGEAVLGSLSLQERFDAIVADNMRRERATIQNRWDWMACRATVDGAVTVSGEDYPTRTIDFGRDASLTITLAGSAQWSQSTATPIMDIQNARQQVFFLSRSPVTQLVFGLEAWNAFVQDDHPDVQELLNGLRKGNQADFNSAGLLSGEPYEYQGAIMGFAGGGRLELWTYHYQYEDADGNWADYLDPGTVIGTGGATDGIRCFGAILDRNSLNAVDMFPKMWDEQDPSVTYTMTQSAPLMVPLRPNNSFAMKVV